MNHGCANSIGASPLLQILSVVFLAALSALNVSAGPLDRRQQCVATCDRVCYWQSSVDEAVDAGYK